VSFTTAARAAALGESRPAAGAASEDRSALVLQLTKSDADALSELTKKHIGNRLVVLLNNEPLFAPEIRTPSIGEDVYIQPATGTDTMKVKAKLEKLAQKRD
jgi:preprotein translocase subunit SecD